MKKTQLVLSDAAVADILEQSDWYAEQSGQPLARRWEKAVTSALLRLLKTPLAGALCAFRSTQLHDVRRTLIVGFPRHLIFYRFQKPELFVLRIVHGARDLENLL